ncbi:hypothetical protein CKAN_00514600 [Cinnamomum micranthum f. kanehirae]|uniref:Uncharacterized protein n=1 Tax=Cinnamomum micranthum f. kanehirae TaxID=337451 RepID=A0A3S3MXD5_9MAGN|nr:hypothetical protein CKAN_00514600 [Cinnamomum micranthum f. kanehirae]
MANGETSDGDQEEQRDKKKKKKNQLDEDIGNPFGNEDELEEHSEDMELDEMTAPPKHRKRKEVQISFYQWERVGSAEPLQDSPLILLACNVLLSSEMS